ncbi:MAG: hypothetical protein ACTSW2_10865, partial [Alphaproteobacteria bacterium]
MDSVQAGGAAFQHFASHGFSLSDAPLLEQAMSELNLAGKVDGVTLRASPFERPWNGISSLLARIEKSGLSVLANVQLPRNNEGVVFDDDSETANHVVEAALIAMAYPSIDVFVDTFVDHDRGYYPRNGLIDRRYNPRPAFHALRAFSVLLSGHGEAVIVRPQSEKETGAIRTFALQAGSFRGILKLAGSGEDDASVILDASACPDGDAGRLRAVDLQTGAETAVRAKPGRDGRVTVCFPAAGCDGGSAAGPKLLILSA